MNDKYQKDLIEQESQWQQERAALLEQIRLGLGGGVGGDMLRSSDHAEELSFKVEHLNSLLQEKNK